MGLSCSLCDTRLARQKIVIAIYRWKDNNESVWTATQLNDWEYLQWQWSIIQSFSSGSLVGPTVHARVVQTIDIAIWHCPVSYTTKQSISWLQSVFLICNLTNEPLSINSPPFALPLLFETTRAYLNEHNLSENLMKRRLQMGNGEDPYLGEMQKK